MLRLPFFSRPPAPPPPAPKVWDLDGLRVTVTRKRIRGLHLRLRPPLGEVHVSAPLRLAERQIRAFVEERRAWILKHQQRLAAQVPAAPLRYEDGESLRFLDTDLTLRLEPGRVCRARLEGGLLRLQAPATAGPRRREAAVQRCLGRALLAEAEALLPARQQALGVRCQGLRVRAMRSRWGSCDIRRARISLSLSLVRHGRRHLDYILVHELAHLRVRDHGPAFKAILDEQLPEWRSLRKELHGTT